MTDGSCPHCNENPAPMKTMYVGKTFHCLSCAEEIKCVDFGEYGETNAN